MMSKYVLFLFIVASTSTGSEEAEGLEDALKERCMYPEYHKMICCMHPENPSCSTDPIDKVVTDPIGEVVEEIEINPRSDMEEEDFEKEKTG